jgi:DnaK suppressor protein
MIAERRSEASHPRNFDRFEAILMDRRKSLLKDAQALEHDERGSTDSSHSIHMAEFGTDSSAHDVSLTCRESVTDEIQEIDEALILIREGSFGTCDGCGKKISQERLEAIPYAKLCLPCKMDEEAL